MSISIENLRAARAGDRAAMDRLMADFRPWLERVAARYSHRRLPDASSADLVQEASLQAWLKLAQFRGHDDRERECNMFRGWLEQIVLRLGQDQLRRANTLRRRPDGKLVPWLQGKPTPLFCRL